MMKNGRKLLEILNVRVVGSGEKVLVLSHGFGTDQSAWQRVLPYFTRDHRVVLYDLVCAGSVNPDHFDFPRYTTLDAYVDDLLAILDALGIERCAFVGHSVSAMIGILAAIRRPELFTKLVLLGASPRRRMRLSTAPELVWPLDGWKVSSPFRRGQQPEAGRERETELPGSQWQVNIPDSSAPKQLPKEHPLDGFLYFLEEINTVVPEEKKNVSKKF